MLVRLLYASRATHPVDHDTLGAILKQSRANNPKQGVTGVLCCCSNTLFLQALEGGRSVVNQLYHRISADPRHQDVMLLSYDEIESRHFASWSMGQVNLSRLNPAVLLKYSPTAALDPLHISGRVAMSLLDELVATAAVVGQGLTWDDEPMKTLHPAKYLVLIEDGEGMVARLFDAERKHLGDFDGSTLEAVEMTAGVTPTQGIDRGDWGRALDGHSDSARAAALVYELNP